MKLSLTRIAANAAVFTVVAACSGGEFTSPSASGTGGSGGSTSDSGTGGKPDSGTGGTSAGGTAGTGAGDSGGLGGSAGIGGQPPDGGTGGVAASGGTGGDAGSGGQGGSVPPPACEGTQFAVSPAVPKAGEPFLISMTVVGGSDYVCTRLVMNCDPLGPRPMPANCTSTGCDGGGTTSCNAGDARITFFKRKRAEGDACCDGDANTACTMGEIGVTEQGTVVAECAFTVYP